MKKKDQAFENKLIRNINRIKKTNKEQLLNEAFLSIKEIKEVDTDKAFINVKQRIEVSRKRSLIIYRLQRIAAVLFLPLLAFSIYVYTSSNDLSLRTVNRTIENPQGVRSQLELPDGSKLWLNSGSSISYQEPFRDRVITLDGEAFFDVTRDKNKAFIVKTENLNVKVHGTRFNVLSYPNEDNTEVVLEEGSVSVITKQGNREYKLVPNNRLLLDNKDGAVNIFKEDINNYIAWHKGKLAFDNASLDEVARTLERWYDIDVIILSDKLEGNRFTSVFENESIYTVKELMELCLPAKIRYIPSQMHENGNISSKAQLLIDIE